jgi:hypothetical protein
MRTRSLLCCVVVAAMGCQGPLVGERASPIVGGTVDTGDPAIVEFDHGCTAEVISPHVLLTAGHCVTPTPKNPTVFTGYDDKMTASGVTLAVKEVHAHPMYNGDAHDIAVVILTNATTITPIPVNRTPLDNTLVGKPMRIVGYGVTNTGGTDDFGVRRQASAPLIRYDNDWVEVGTQAATQCFGDSGGPALMTVNGVEVIVGVDSFGFDQGDTCVERNGDTRVDTHLAFIDQYVKANDPNFMPGAPPDAGTPPPPTSDDGGTPNPPAPDFGTTPNPPPSNGSNGSNGAEMPQMKSGCNMAARDTAVPLWLLALLVLAATRRRFV